MLVRASLRPACGCSRRSLPLATLSLPHRQLHLTGHFKAPCARREEQTLSRFYEKRYYPVTIGQVFNGRYRVVAKLGYGAHSTVWLARDQRTDKFASLKVCTCDDAASRNERDVFRQIAASSPGHPGSSLVRLPTDTFHVDGHCCFVLEPQAFSLRYLQNLMPGGRMPAQAVAAFAKRFIACLNWLQLEAGIVHTDISAFNIMLGANDDQMFQKAERDEIDNPSIPTSDHTHPFPHPIFESRCQSADASETSYLSVLSDFGQARLLPCGAQTSGWAMPDTYRAPEVLMSLPWDHAVDIWSIGMMCFELLEGRNLFGPIDPVHKQYVLPLALAQYIGVMGPPPLWMIQQSSEPVIATFFDKHGSWIGEPPIEETPLEDMITAIPPGPDKDGFLKFMQKILTWSPAERAHSADLFEDEWLSASLRAAEPV